MLDSKLHDAVEAPVDIGENIALVEDEAARLPRLTSDILKLVGALCLEFK